MNLISLTAAGFCLVALPSIPATDTDSPKMDIVDTAKSAGSFKTLLAAVKTAGLEGVLRSKGPFTVFAPTDAAFAKLPKGTVETLLEPANRAALKAILTYHVIAGDVNAAAALRAGRATTLAEKSVKIELIGGRLQVQGANVINNDIAATNGTIHVIDRVLIPEMNKSTAILEATPQSLIETAIERGVPLYNEGQEAACAAIYEIAASALLQSSAVSEGDRAKIANALRRSAKESRSDAAWTLRGVLDSTYESLNRPQPKSRHRTLRKRTMSNISIFEFESEAEAASFRPLNDTVMGGRSSSRMTPNGKTAVFTGKVSLENRGGFASVRAPIQRGALSGLKGVTMRVRGDGRKYRFTARQNRSGYDIEFQTRDGEWMEVRLPFSKLSRNIRGWRPSTKAPAPKDLTGIGVLIGDKKAGDFRLEIDWIRGYSD